MNQTERLDAARNEFRLALLKYITLLEPGDEMRSAVTSGLKHRNITKRWIAKEAGCTATFIDSVLTQPINGPSFKKVRELAIKYATFGAN